MGWCFVCCGLVGLVGFVLELVVFDLVWMLEVGLSYITGWVVDLLICWGGVCCWVLGWLLGWDWVVTLGFCVLGWVGWYRLGLFWYVCVSVLRGLGFGFCFIPGCLAVGLVFVLELLWFGGGFG